MEKRDALVLKDQEDQKVNQEMMEKKDIWEDKDQLAQEAHVVQ